MAVRNSTRRSWIFNLCLWGVAILNFVMICFAVSACFGTYFEVSNESIQPDVASLFRRLSLEMRGFCWVPLGASDKQCSLVPLYRMFFDMPNLTFPTEIRPETLQRTLQQFGGQNPILFYGVLMATILCLANIINCFRIRAKPVRALGVTGLVLSLVILIVSAVTYGVTSWIYGDKLMQVLNRPMTIRLQGGEDVTGRLSDVGIKLREGDGKKELACMLAFSVFALAFSGRLLPKTKNKAEYEREQDGMRFTP